MALWAAYGQQGDRRRQPKFFEAGIPTQGKLTDSEKYEPRIYFSPERRIFDRGRSEAPNPGIRLSDRFRKAPTNTFKGIGGPKIGNIFSRLLYAIRFGPTRSCSPTV